MTKVPSKLFGEWYIYSPQTQQWAACNYAMGMSLLNFMKLAPAGYEGWKVAFIERPGNFVYVSWK